MTQPAHTSDWSVVRRWTTWCVTQEFTTFDLELVEPLPSSPTSSTPQPTTCTTSVWEAHCVRASAGVIGVQATWRGVAMRRCCVFVLIVSRLLLILKQYRLSAAMRMLILQLRMATWIWFEICELMASIALLMVLMAQL